MHDDLLAYCPFHSNSDTPSFSIGLKNGLWLCYNPSCGARGNLPSLLKRLGVGSAAEVDLLLQQESFPDIQPLNFEAEPEVEYEESTLQRHVEQLANSKGGVYVNSRGFGVDFCKQYDIGYAPEKNAVSMGVRDPRGKLLGEVFRSLDEKKYRNSYGMDKSSTLWNIDKAKRKPTAVICEGTFDGLACIRAGHNAVSLLGGGGKGISAEQATILNTYFTKLYIFTDDDAPGKQFGISIAEEFAREVLFVPYLDTGLKDPGALSDEQINRCIDGALTEFEVLSGLTS